MKENKKLILGFILGVIVTSFITVGAFSYTAMEIGYEPKDKTWKVKTVKEAINDLKSSGIRKVCTLKSGDALAIGSMYECNPSLDGTTKYNFYVLKNDASSVKLIMDRNISDSVGTSISTDWQGAINFFRNGVGKNIGWKVAVDLPDAQDIADAVGNTEWNLSTKDTSGYFHFTKAADGTYGHSSISNKDNPSVYGWLYNYTKKCTNWGCSIESDTAFAYWTQSPVVKSLDQYSYAWEVSANGNLTYGDVTNSHAIGVRPVITIKKSEL